MSTGLFAERNGWSLYAYAAFGDAFEGLSDAVEDLRKKQPESYESHPKAKLLRRIIELILDEIPRDPNGAAYQLGNTLGGAHRHWRRAKFLGRFRLFYRFSTAHKAIVYAWVNDETTLRKAGSRTDPYASFNKRLRDGDPPDGWDDLFRKAVVGRPIVAAAAFQAAKPAEKPAAGRIARPTFRCF
jgi:toxin YhaV